MKYTVLDSPIGPLMLAGDETVLRELWFLQGRQRAAPNPAWTESARAFADVTRQLKAYFVGRLQSFNVAVDPGGTVFQRKVWHALQGIPYGETVSYGEVARRIGDWKAVRAVGLANGRNPISIIIPCHRVIGASGALVGYGGGLPTKRALLSLEQGQGALL
ncbi:MAG: methylated-DNA--[protein]-cysteine S-methyltransferase [Acidobacteriota bacterium]